MVAAIVERPEQGMWVKIKKIGCKTGMLFERGGKVSANVAVKCQGTR